MKNLSAVDIGGGRLVVKRTDLESIGRFEFFRINNGRKGIICSRVYKDGKLSIVRTFGAGYDFFVFPNEQYLTAISNSFNCCGIEADYDLVGRNLTDISSKVYDFFKGIFKGKTVDKIDRRVDFKD